MTAAKPKTVEIALVGNSYGANDGDVREVSVEQAESLVERGLAVIPSGDKP